MAQVRFSLHHKHKDGSYSILMSYRCDGGRIFKQLVGERVQPRKWSKKTQRVLGAVIGSFEFNRHLDQLQGRVVEALRRIRMQSKAITPEAIKQELSGEFMSFWEYVAKFEESPPQEIGPGTLKIYTRMLKHLRKIAPGLSFSEVGQSAVDAYIKYRRKQRKNDSTIRTELTKLRAIMNYAVKARVISAAPVLELNIAGVDPDEIYLTESEILSIYSLIGNNPELADYIRVFVLGTQIGVRVSDLDIKPEYVGEIKSKTGQKMKAITLVAEKTEQQVIVPLTKLAEEILQYYDWQVPKFIDQTLNYKVKEAAEKAGIKDTVVWREKIDGEIIETVYEKWQLVSSHTMRRSFATNLYKRGAPSLMIMKITGHKKESSFLKYIRVSKQEAAEAISAFM